MPEAVNTSWNKIFESRLAAFDYESQIFCKYKNCLSHKTADRVLIRKKLFIFFI